VVFNFFGVFQFLVNEVDPMSSIGWWRFVLGKYMMSVFPTLLQKGCKYRNKFLSAFQIQVINVSLITAAI
jgi:hypothetical protein